MMIYWGMPWHVAHNPDVEYKRRIVKVNEDILYLESPDELREKEISTITNISKKKFRELLKSRSKDVEVFQVLINESDDVSKAAKP